MSSARLMSSTVQKGMASKVLGAIEREWGNIPVRDAERELRVFILPEDISCATKQDPAYCVFAQACRRTFKCDKVMFYRTIAYLELPNPQGKKHIERFNMPRNMRRLVESFDQGNPIIPEAGFLLLPPSPSTRLEAQRESDKRSREKERDKRQVLGTSRSGGHGENAPLSMANPFIRSGKGQVKFISRRSKEEMAKKFVGNGRS